MAKKPLHQLAYRAIRIEGGLIAEGWNYFDFDGLNEQISG